MIIIRLDRVLADRKMRLNDLAAQVGISNVNLSYLKTLFVRFCTVSLGIFSNTLRSKIKIRNIVLLGQNICFYIAVCLGRPLFFYPKNKKGATAYEQTRDL